LVYVHKRCSCVAGTNSGSGGSRFESWRASQQITHEMTPGASPPGSFYRPVPHATLAVVRLAVPSSLDPRHMRTRLVIRFVAAILIAVGLARCDNASFIGQARAGWRQFIVTVENQSPRPARLVVAEDRSPIGEPTGTAEPGVVAPGVTVDVNLGIPPGQGWAIFVNPGDPGMGPLVTAHDVPPGAIGRMPFKVQIDLRGQVSAAVEAGPGWFGN